MTLVRHDGGAYGVASSPDGTMLVSSGWDGKLRIAEIATGRQIAALHIGSNSNHSALWSPDGRSVAGGCKALSRWDVSTKKCAARFKGHKHTVNTAGFSPDGTRLATGSGDSWMPVSSFTPRALVAPPAGSRSASSARAGRTSPSVDGAT